MHPYYEKIRSLSALCDQNKKYAALRLPEIIEKEVREGNFMVIGGNVVGVYTEPRVTLDVDVVVDKNAFDGIKKKLDEVGISYKNEGLVLRIEEPEEFDIVDKSISPIIQAVFEDRVSKDNYYIPSIEGLLALKYYAVVNPTRAYHKRYQDIADILYLLKSNPDRTKILQYLNIVGTATAELFVHNVLERFDKEEQIIV